MVDWAEVLARGVSEKRVATTVMVLGANVQLTLVCPDARTAEALGHLLDDSAATGGVRLTIDEHDGLMIEGRPR